VVVLGVEGLDSVFAGTDVAGGADGEAVEEVPESLCAAFL